MNFEGPSDPSCHRFPGSTEPLFETAKQIAWNVEAAGFDSFSVMDHVCQIRAVGPAAVSVLYRM